MKAVFYEMPAFTDNIDSHFGSDDEYRRFQTALMDNPEKGRVIPQAGAVRKVRWPGRGHGTRGGLRVIYQHIPEFNHFLMLVVYFKGDVEELTLDEQRYLAAYAERYVEHLRRKHTKGG